MDWISPRMWRAAVRRPSCGNRMTHRSPPELHSDIVITPVPDLAARASLIADRFFASPSRQLDVIGVTGTNGKTTCAWLLAQALTACRSPRRLPGHAGNAVRRRR